MLVARLRPSQWARRLPPPTASYSSLDAHKNSSLHLEADLHSKSADSAHLLTQNATHSVYIQPWEAIESMADAYSIIRAVERKYGRIREFRFHRDREVPERYQTNIWAIFRSAASLPLVPLDGDVLHIPAPRVDPAKLAAGGIGLEDLQGLMEPQDRSEGEHLPSWGHVLDRVLDSPEPSAGGTGTPRSRVIDVRVERARREYPCPSAVDVDEMTRSRRLAIGHAFVKWGGFYDLKPVAASPFVAGSSAESQPQAPIDHVRMRAVLTKWSQFTRRPDPSIALASERAQHAPKSLPTADTHTLPSVEWEPIPDPDRDAILGLADPSEADLETKAQKSRSRRARRELAKAQGQAAPDPGSASDGSSGEGGTSTGANEALDLQAAVAAVRAKVDRGNVGDGRQREKRGTRREGSVEGSDIFTERLKSFVGKWF